MLEPRNIKTANKTLFISDHSLKPHLTPLIGSVLRCSQQRRGPKPGPSALHNSPQIVSTSLPPLGEGRKWSYIPDCLPLSFLASFSVLWAQRGCLSVHGIPLLPKGTPILSPPIPCAIPADRMWGDRNIKVEAINIYLKIILFLFLNIQILNHQMLEQQFSFPFCR